MTYVVDWAGTGAMIQGLGTLVGAGTVFLAARIGANTFETWRKQKIAERQIEQAERILTAVYKARRGLSRVRNPMILAGELAKAAEDVKSQPVWEGATPAEKDRLKSTQAYFNRLTLTASEREGIEACQPLARAMFGEAIEDALETLNAKFWSVRVYAEAYWRDREGGDADLREKIDQVLYEGYPSAETNAVDLEIKAAVKLIEDKCLPFIRLDIN